MIMNSRGEAHFGEWDRAMQEKKNMLARGVVAKKDNWINAYMDMGDCSSFSPYAPFVLLCLRDQGIEERRDMRCWDGCVLCRSDRCRW